LTPKLSRLEVKEGPFLSAAGTGDKRELTAKLRAVATESSPEARIAYDGMDFILR